MADQRPYTFIVLRYVHDPLSAEFVNVGLVAHFPEWEGNRPVLKAQTRKTIGRMRDMFPDLGRADFVSAMQNVDRALSRLAKQVDGEGMLPSGVDAGAFALRALPKDDSALQWSSLGSGLSRDMEKTFEALFARHITHYDQQNDPRRSDDDVWRPVRACLDARHIAIDLDQKVIRGDDDEVLFRHAWKNGSWHVYEPISLDLADTSGIANKAHTWLGKLSSIWKDAAEEFQPHFIVGAPLDQRLEGAYQKAIRILKKAPMEVRIYEESEINLLVSHIERDVAAHREAQAE